MTGFDIFGQTLFVSPQYLLVNDNVR